jgi:hypothetical protein
MQPPPRLWCAKSHAPLPSINAHNPHNPPHSEPALWSGHGLYSCRNLGQNKVVSTCHHCQCQAITPSAPLQAVRDSASRRCAGVSLFSSAFDATRCAMHPTPHLVDNPAAHALVLPLIVKLQSSLSFMTALTPRYTYITDTTWFSTLRHQ